MQAIGIHGAFASGVDPKTAEAKKIVETAVESSVETAVRSLGIANQSRQQETTQIPASKESIGWTGIIAIAAVVGIQLGAIYWLNNSIRNNKRAGFESASEEHSPRCEGSFDSQICLSAHSRSSALSTM